MFLWYWHFISFQFCLPLTLARRLKKRNAMARHRARGSPPVALEAPEFQESKLNSEGQMCRHVVTSCPHVCQCAVLHDCVCCVYIHIRSYPCLVSLSCNSRLREIVWRGCGLMGPLKWKSVDTTCTECRYIDIFIYIYMHIYVYYIYIYWTKIASICEPKFQVPCLCALAQTPSHYPGKSCLQATPCQGLNWLSVRSCTMFYLGFVMLFSVWPVGHSWSYQACCGWPDEAEFTESRRYAKYYLLSNNWTKL